MMTDQKIRLVVIDDHEMVRRGLVIGLETLEDVEVVAVANDGAEAAQLCAQLHPDVVLMDLVMPEMNGVMATRLIRQTYPEIQVVALTSFSDDEELVQSVLEAGAAACVHKRVSLDELGDAIRSAAALT